MLAFASVCQNRIELSGWTVYQASNLPGLLSGFISPSLWQLKEVGTFNRGDSHWANCQKLPFPASLEEVFQQGNHPDGCPWMLAGARSISVGDVIRDTNGEFWLVRPEGFCPWESGLLMV